MRVCAGLLLLAGWVCIQAHGKSGFIGIPVTEWRLSATNDVGERVFESAVVDLGFPATELIASWNTSSNAAMEIEVSRDLPKPRWLSLGAWSLDDRAFPRTSRKTAGNAPDRVDTDTLIFATPEQKVKLRQVWRRGTPMVDLKFFGVLAWSPQSTSADASSSDAPRLASDIPPISVPVLSQADYPEGIKSWCSPTSLTMALQALDPQRFAVLSVPEVARGVMDPGWPGTGNWSFNVAYAGTFSGVRALVSRFDGLDEIDEWLRKGRPVVCSVSYSMMNGKSSPRRGDGHLVVVIGRKKGLVCIHDPGRGKERVRREISEADFLRGWRHSRQTVYLVHRDDESTPAHSHGHWP